MINGTTKDDRGAVRMSNRVRRYSVTLEERPNRRNGRQTWRLVGTGEKITRTPVFVTEELSMCFLAV